MAEQRPTASTPRPGDRVRLTYGDGSAVEGTWGQDGDGRDVLIADDGTVYQHVTGQVRRERLPDSRPGAEGQAR